MRNTYTIKSKEEAYTYIYNVRNNIEEATPELIEQAETYFEPGELACTLFNPPHRVEDCFRVPNYECSCNTAEHNGL